MLLGLGRVQADNPGAVYTEVDLGSLNQVFVLVDFNHKLGTPQITWEVSLNESLCRSGWPVGVSDRAVLIV